MKPLWAVPLVLLAGAATVGAQSDQDPEPGRAVARVSVINGDVTMQRADTGDWMAAAINTPLLAGDAVATGRGSRTELQLDYSNFVRLGENTEVRLAGLDGGRYQLQVASGLVTYSLLRDRTADVEISTPGVAVRPLRAGVYRLEVRPNGDAEITVRGGEAEIASSYGSERLGPGRTLITRMGAGDRTVEVQQVAAAGRDEWDRWNDSRDQYLQRSRSYNYVPPGVYGAEDLDGYGDWRSVDNYGAVWFPRVGAGWAPYSSGRWAWVDWYGWTWVSYDPWGWAPFHYGRWYRDTRWGWGWCPGPARVRTYWSPALVGFFGWGGRGGVSIGVGFGYNNIGWVPLAPGERFHPWYGSRYYGGRGNQVNITNVTNVYNVTNIRNVYRNANVDGAVYSAGAANFGRGMARPERVRAAEVNNAGQIRGMLPVVPERDSLRFSDRTAARPAVASVDRGSRYFQRQTPAPVERVPFEQQRQNMSRLFQGGGAAGTAAPAPAAAINPGSSPGSPQRPGAVTPGWRRFGDPEPASNPPAAFSERNVDRGNRSGRFGEQNRPAQSYEQTVDRSGRWRRSNEANQPSSTAPALTPQDGGRRGRPFGDQPAANNPPPQQQNNIDRGFRNRDRAPQAVAPPPQQQQQQFRPSPPPQREAQPFRGNPEGGGRQVDLHRPIMRERAPQPQAPPQQSSGGERRGNHSGGHGRR